MTIPISSSGGTPKGFLDSSRPRQMEDADKVFQLFVLRNGDDPMEAMDIALKLATAITETKGFELDTLWEKIEKKLNGSRSLAVRSKTDGGKAQTAYGVFYSLLDTIDQKATSTAELQVVKDLFSSVELHVANKWHENVTPQEKRVLQRIAKTTNNRLADMKERFNTLVEEGMLGGPPVR